MCDQHQLIKDAAKFRKHLRDTHRMTLPKKGLRSKHKNDEKYFYCSELLPGVTKHYGCPSCLFHAADLNQLGPHITKEHPEANDEDTAVLQSTRNPGGRQTDSNIHIGSAYSQLL